MKFSNRFKNLVVFTLLITFTQNSFAMYGGNGNVNNRNRQNQGIRQWLGNQFLGVAGSVAGATGTLVNHMASRFTVAAAGGNPNDPNAGLGDAIRNNMSAGRQVV